MSPRAFLAWAVSSISGVFVVKPERSNTLWHNDLKYSIGKCPDVMESLVSGKPAGSLKIQSVGSMPLLKSHRETFPLDVVACQRLKPLVTLTLKTLSISLFF